MANCIISYTSNFNIIHACMNETIFINKFLPTLAHTQRERERHIHIFLHKESIPNSTTVTTPCVVAEGNNWRLSSRI